MCHNLGIYYVSFILRTWFFLCIFAKASRREAHRIKFALLNLAGAIFQVRMHPGATGDERLSTGNEVMERDMGRSVEPGMLLKSVRVRLFGDCFFYSRSENVLWAKKFDD